MYNVSNSSEPLALSFEQVGIFPVFPSLSILLCYYLLLNVIISSINYFIGYNVVLKDPHKHVSYSNRLVL